MGFEAALEMIEQIKRSQPQNIAMQCFDTDEFVQLAPELQRRLLGCIRSGLENPDSAMGCYATHVSDYDDLHFFFRKVIAAHHDVSIEAQHFSDWALSRNCNLAALGLPAASVRVRVGRNLIGFPFPASMTLKDRTALEQSTQPVFQQLNKLPGFEGAYHSLTPGHTNELGSDQYRSLVDAHLMFKNMDDDPYLKSAGITADWPHGRGCYVSNNRDFIVWVGEEDHLRIMFMETTTDLNSVFNRLKSALDHIQLIDGIEFALSPQWGAVTSCPTNLGTGMRASVHLPLPKLALQKNSTGLQELARECGLALRGAGGEHTAFSADGTVDVSPQARFCVTEREILEMLYDGIRVLVEHEQSAR